MNVRRFMLVLAVASMTGGCAVFAVADAAVTVVATTVKVGAKVVGAGVEAVLPDDDGDGDEGKGR
jgi:tRNA A58 N-methylase Trm61